MYKYFFILFLYFSSFFISGCFGIMEVNDTVVAVGRGIDLEGQEIHYTAQLAPPESKDGSNKEASEQVVISTQGESLAEGARNLYLILPRRPLWSMISTIVIGENLAREDITIFADYVLRNRNIRLNANMYLASNCTPEEVFKVKVPLEKYSARALNKLIRLQENQLGIYMAVQAEEFLSKAETPGIEPVLPQVIIEKQGDQEYLKLEGTAVFQDKKLVGSLNKEESRGLSFMGPRKKTGGLLLVPSPLQQDKRITLELIDSSSKAKAEFIDGKIKIIVDIKAEGNFYEQNDEVDYLALENIPKVESAAKENIKKDVEACITKAQALHSDIFGWGLNISRNKPDEWKTLQSDWPQIFSEVETEINVDFKLRRGYLVDRMFKSNS